MRTIADLLALAGLAIGSASAATAGTEGAGTGVPLVVAKRLAQPRQRPSQPRCGCRAFRCVKRRSAWARSDWLR
ncbi:hypothetical protein X551_00176 [Methylibium sp. T29]|nr:hypothetical protein X551_00176 [Methylibium sp. T29]EWS62241.1 hypothetical protein Y694_00084 [Methylibium sp. T29-B]